MNETREILKKALGDYSPDPGSADELRDRTRRRRRTGRVVSGVVAFALFLAAGGALWLAFDGPHGRRGSRPADQATSQSFRAIANGLGIERPAGWTLVESGSVRVSAGEGGSQWPILQLSDFDAQLGPFEYGPRSACQGSDQVPSDGLSLYVMRDVGEPLMDSEQYPSWPVSLNVSHISGGACGQGTYTYWTNAGKDFEAFVAAGNHVPEADLALIRSIFASMDFSFASAQDSFHAAADSDDSAARSLHQTSSKLVLAGSDGTGVDSGPWTMSVMQDPNRVLQQSTAVVVVEMWSEADVWIVPENWPGRSLGFTSWCSKEVSNLVVGQVGRDVSRLDLISSEGAISRPEILPVPGSVSASFDVFVGRLPDAQQGTLVALSSVDEELYRVGGTDGPGCDAPLPPGPEAPLTSQLQQAVEQLRKDDASGVPGSVTLADSRRVVALRRQIEAAKRSATGVPVPDVIGLPFDHARQVIEAAGLQLGEVQLGSDQGGLQIVVGEDPASNAHLDPGGSVSLVLARA